jgi:hypothetical protein
MVTVDIGLSNGFVRGGRHQVEWFHHDQEATIDVGPKQWLRVGDLQIVVVEKQSNGLLTATKVHSTTLVDELWGENHLLSRWNRSSRLAGRAGSTVEAGGSRR